MAQIDLVVRSTPNVAKLFHCTSFIWLGVPGSFIPCIRYTHNDVTDKRINMHTRSFGNYCNLHQLISNIMILFPSYWWFNQQTWIRLYFVHPNLWYGGWILYLTIYFVMNIHVTKDKLWFTKHIFLKNEIYIFPSKHWSSSLRKTESMTDVGETAVAVVVAVEQAPMSWEDQPSWPVASFA